MHELDKYWTLTQFADYLGVSIPRVTRLFERLKVPTHKIGAAIVADREHKTVLKNALKNKLIRRGRVANAAN